MRMDEQNEDGSQTWVQVSNSAMYILNVLGELLNILSLFHLYTMGQIIPIFEDYIYE